MSVDHTKRDRGKEQQDGSFMSRWSTYRRSAHAALLKLLKGGRGSLGSLDKLELGLAAVGALRLRHFGDEAQPFTLQQASDV